MPYLGQSPSKGDENNFKILDDISSYTLTFDGSSASVVSAANDTITTLNHRFITGQRVTYNKGSGFYVDKDIIDYIIEPLPISVDGVRNPLIVRDEEERKAAQEVINQTPQAVIDSINT